MSAKPTIKRELMEVDDDVVEILPRRAVAPNGSGFAVKIRDTNELTEADIRFIKPFLKLPSIIPTVPARFTMRELSATGGWELLLQDTSTLTLMHMQSILEIIDSRERAIRSTQGPYTVPPQHFFPQATAYARPGFDLTGLLNAQAAGAEPQKRGKMSKDPNAPKRPPTAYVLWAKENRHHMTASGMSVSQANKALGDAWKALSKYAREPWQRVADEEKRRCLRELADYKKAQDEQQ